MERPSGSQGGGELSNRAAARGGDDQDARRRGRRRKEAILDRERLKNVVLRHALERLERAIRAKERLADGLHLIDFEQLKIENHGLHEKIEERDEELLKLRKKTTTTVQILTHSKEKLQFVARENEALARGHGAPRGGGRDEEGHADASEERAGRVQARSISHWSPYDRVGVVNADP